MTVLLRVSIAVAVVLGVAAQSAWAGHLATSYPGSSITVTYEGSGAVRTYSGKHDKEDPYSAGGKTWKVYLDPEDVTAVENPDETFFTDVVEAAFPAADGWQFSDSANELSENSLTVKTYDAQYTGSAVGLDILVTYEPGEGDPTDNIHWLQVFKTNNKSGESPPPAVNDHRVDNGSSATPFYDSVGTADSGGDDDGNDIWQFGDRPRRDDLEFETDWDAQLFLVTVDPADAKKVTIWSGLEYGFAVKGTPEPSSLILIGIGLGTVGMCAGRRRRRAA